MLDTRGQPTVIQVQAGSKFIDLIGVDTETTCNDVIKTVLQTNRVVADPNTSQYQLVYRCKTKKSALDGNAKVLEVLMSSTGVLVLRPLERINSKHTITARAKKNLQRLVTFVRKYKKHNLSIETKDVDTKSNTTINNNLNISSKANNRNKYVSKNIPHALTMRNNIQNRQKLVNRYVDIIYKHDVDKKNLEQSTSNTTSTTLNRGFVNYDEITDVEEAVSDNENSVSGYYNAENDVTVKPKLRDVFNDCIIEYDDGDYTEISDCDSVFDSSSNCELERNIIDDHSATAEPEHIKLAFNGAGLYLRFTVNGDFQHNN